MSDPLAFPKPDRTIPASSGGAGSYDDHEQRLRVIERLAAQIEERLKHMPTTATIWQAVAAGAGLAAAMTTAIARSCSPPM